VSIVHAPQAGQGRPASGLSGPGGRSAHRLAAQEGGDAVIARVLEEGISGGDIEQGPNPVLGKKYLDVTAFRITPFGRWLLEGLGG
jgi:hypothetical protein